MSSAVALPHTRSNSVGISSHGLAISAPVIAATLTAAIALIVLAGWWLDIEQLRSWVPGTTAMAFNTAAAFLVSAGSLVLLSRSRIVSGRILAAVVLAFGVMTVIERVTDRSFGFDDFLFAGSNVRVARSTAACFICVSVSLLLYRSSRRAVRVIAIVAAGLAAVMAGVVFLGYAYGVSAYYRQATFTAMAVHTSIGFLLLSLGTIVATEGNWLRDVIGHDSAGSRLARYLIPTAIAVSAIMGWLRLAGEHVGLFATGTAVALLVTADSVVFVFLILFAARVLDRADALRVEREMVERQSDERFRLFAQATRDPIVDWDLDTGEFWVSPALVTEFGYTPESIDSTLDWFTAQIHDEDRDATVDAIRRAVTDGALHWSGECRFKLGNGSYAHVLLRFAVNSPLGEAKRVIGAMTDITPIREAERALRVAHEELEKRVAERTAELRSANAELIAEIGRRQALQSELQNERDFISAVLETSGALIVVIDRDMRVIRFNRAAEMLTGYRAAEIAGKRIDDVFLTEHERDEVRDAAGTLLEGNFPNVHDNHWRTKSGELRWIRWFNTVVSVGSSSFIVSSGIDMTEERRARQRIEETNRELEAFSYSVSHDLRAPLRTIEGFSRALVEDQKAKLDPVGIEHIDRITRGVRKMTDLIDGMLVLSRVTRTDIRRSEVDLSAIADDVIAGLRCEEPARAVVAAVKRPLRVLGDRRLLASAIDNLLRNAWKFSSPRETAQIEVGRTDNGTFFVRDNGVGFDPRYSQKLFVPFQRLHSQREFSGTGIGLATVQRIVRKHGGRVWAESQPDAGATFFFTLQESPSEPPNE